MKWMLIYIFITPFEIGNPTSLQPTATNAMGGMTVFDSMTECFRARENLADKVGKGYGYFHTNSQAICIPVDK